MNQLRDIKPLVDISDFSLYIFWGLIILVVGILIFLLIIFIKKFSFKKNKEKEYLAALSRIDWSNPKKAAYEATYYGRLLANDDRREKLFEELVKRLEPYKYKKEVGKVDEDVIKYFNLYKQVCDESI